VIPVEKVRVAVNHLRAAKGIRPLGPAERPAPLEVCDAFALIESAKGRRHAAWLWEHAPVTAAVLCGRRADGLTPVIGAHER
jgi:hypothetical protein